MGNTGQYKVLLGNGLARRCSLAALIETVNSDQPLQKLLYGDNKAALNRTLENKARAHQSTCFERSSQETRTGMAGIDTTGCG